MREMGLTIDQRDETGNLLPEFFRFLIYLPEKIGNLFVSPFFCKCSFDRPSAFSCLRARDTWKRSSSNMIDRAVLKKGSILERICRHFCWAPTILSFGSGCAGITSSRLLQRGDDASWRVRRPCATARRRSTVSEARRPAARSRAGPRLDRESVSKYGNFDGLVEIEVSAVVKLQHHVCTIYRCSPLVGCIGIGGRKQVILAFL